MQDPANGPESSPNALTPPSTPPVDASTSTKPIHRNAVFEKRVTRSQSATTVKSSRQVDSELPTPKDDSLSGKFKPTSPTPMSLETNTPSSLDESSPSFDNRPETHEQVSSAVLRRNNRTVLPTPVPNLTKKSRGRRVPTAESIDNLSEELTSNARAYVCSVEGCGKAFHRGEHLKRHIRSIHTHEKPFKCQHPDCPKLFNRHDNLLQHLKVHKDLSPSSTSSTSSRIKPSRSPRGEKRRIPSSSESSDEEASTPPPLPKKFKGMLSPSRSPSRSTASSELTSQIYFEQLATQNRTSLYDNPYHHRTSHHPTYVMAMYNNNNVGVYTPTFAPVEDISGGLSSADLGVSSVRDEMPVAEKTQME